MAVVAVPRSLARATFSLADRVLAISADDEAVCHILRTTYDDARVSEARTIHHQAAITRLSDGRMHVRFDRRTLGLTDGASTIPLLSAYYAVKEVFARFASAVPRGVAFYGAAVAVNGSAVLILGPTSIGKTLFALHLAWQGATFLGDETALLDTPAGTLTALARKPSLREGALDLLPPGMPECITEAPHAVQTERGRFWYALTPAQLGGVAPLHKSLRLRAVCVIRDRAPACSIRRANLADVLSSIMQRAYIRPSQLAQISGLRRAMRDVAHYEVTLADPQSSAAAFLRELA